MKPYHKYHCSQRFDQTHLGLSVNLPCTLLTALAKSSYNSSLPLKSMFEQNPWVRTRQEMWEAYQEWLRSLTWPRRLFCLPMKGLAKSGKSDMNDHTDFSPVAYLWQLFSWHCTVSPPEVGIPRSAFKIDEINSLIEFPCFSSGTWCSLCRSLPPNSRATFITACSMAATSAEADSQGRGLCCVAGLSPFLRPLCAVFLLMSHSWLPKQYYPVAFLTIMWCFSLLPIILLEFPNDFAKCFGAALKYGILRTDRVETTINKTELTRDNTNLLYMFRFGNVLLEVAKLATKGASRLCKINIEIESSVASLPTNLRQSAFMHAQSLLPLMTLGVSAVEISEKVWRTSFCNLNVLVALSVYCCAAGKGAA